MTAFDSELQIWMKQMQSIKNMIANASEKIATKVEDLIDQQISNATDPYGSPWKLDKSGKKPLQGINKYVDVSSTGQGIKVNLSGPAPAHNTGGGNLPQRKIIPDGPIPTNWQEAIKTSLDEEFKNLIKKE